MNQPRSIILVSGSSGRIGDAVMRRFTGHFSDVVGFDRKAPSPPPPGCTHIPLEITSDQSVADALRVVREHHGTRIAAMIHLAAYYDFTGDPANKDKYQQITVRGTQRLLRGLKDFHVEQFLFSSTMLVHAPCEPGQKINEDWPIEPKWDYPKSKVQTEALIRAERGDIPAVLMRIAGVYDDRCHSIPLAEQMQRIYERKLTSRVFPGSTSHGQAFVHLDDVVEAIWLAVERRAQLPPEVPLLIGEDETLSYDELQHTFARLIHGESWETKEIPKALAKTGAWVQGHIPGIEDPFIKPWMIDLADDHYELDITRAKNLLGSVPRRTLRETIPKMVAALKSDPAKFYKDNELGEPPAAKSQ